MQQRKKEIRHLRFFFSFHSDAIQINPFSNPRAPLHVGYSIGIRLPKIKCAPNVNDMRVFLLLSNVQRRKMFMIVIRHVIGDGKIALQGRPWSWKNSLNGDGLAVVCQVTRPPGASLIWKKIEKKCPVKTASYFVPIHLLNFICNPVSHPPLYSSYQKETIQFISFPIALFFSTGGKMCETFRNVSDFFYFCDFH